jgi:hypothetical protein
MNRSPALGDTFHASSSWQTTSGSVTISSATPSALLALDCDFMEATGELRLDNVVVLGM